MAKKLTLDLENVAVESFPVAGTAASRGTVVARSDTTGIDYCTDNQMDCGLSFPYACVPADTQGSQCSRVDC